MSVIDDMQGALEITPEQRAKLDELDKVRQAEYEKRVAEIAASHGRSAQLVQKYKPNRKQRRKQEALIRKVAGKKRAAKEKKDGR